ncbi:unnamed protein product [Protopolystoma xenopodis]|uniref:Uncharacterized protein n=1 Tax=Protopolystoma xenopodis TaxID=117903 RepID=A0A448XJH5_9PLAT|nr:unnamed protein product [Protopolystoma xenopodis]
MNFDFALRLAEVSTLCGQPAIATHPISQLYALHLFHKAAFREALDLFYQLNTNPIDVLGMCANFLPDHLRSYTTYPAPLKVSPLS